MRKPDFNGPNRELLGGGHLDQSVYCVNCGTIFLSAAPQRDCPSCTLANEVEELRERIEELEADDGE